LEKKKRITESKIISSDRGGFTKPYFKTTKGLFDLI